MKSIVKLELLPKNNTQYQNIIETMITYNELCSKAGVSIFVQKPTTLKEFHETNIKKFQSDYPEFSHQIVKLALYKTYEVYKKNGNIQPVFKDENLVILDTKCFRVKDISTVNIQTIVGRIDVPFIYSKYYAYPENRNKSHADLILEDDDKLVLYTECDMANYEETLPKYKRQPLGLGV